MNPDLILPIVMRWLHIFAAIVAVGGSIFLRFVLAPVAKATLEPETHIKLRENVSLRWMKFVHTCILLFLVSGFYNYLVITAPQHPDQPLYHALFGTKFLLALVVFALAIVLTSSKSFGYKARENAKVWLSLLVFCAVAIVMISGVMKNLPKAGPVAEPAAVEDAAGGD